MTINSTNPLPKRPRLDEYVADDPYKKQRLQQLPVLPLEILQKIAIDVDCPYKAYAFLKTNYWKVEPKEMTFFWNMWRKKYISTWRLETWGLERDENLYFKLCRVYENVYKSKPHEGVCEFSKAFMYRADRLIQLKCERTLGRLSQENPSQKFTNTNKLEPIAFFHIKYFVSKVVDLSTRYEFPEAAIQVIEAMPYFTFDDHVACTLKKVVFLSFKYMTEKPIDAFVEKCIDKKRKGAEVLKEACIDALGKHLLSDSTQSKKDRITLFRKYVKNINTLVPTQQHWSLQRVRDEIIYVRLVDFYMSRVHRGHLEIAEWLINQGASPNRQRVLASCNTSLQKTWIKQILRSKRVGAIINEDYKVAFQCAFQTQDDSLLDLLISRKPRKEKLLRAIPFNNPFWRKCYKEMLAGSLNSSEKKKSFLLSCFEHNQDLNNEGDVDLVNQSFHQMSESNSTHFPTAAFTYVATENHEEESSDQSQQQLIDLVKSPDSDFNFATLEKLIVKSKADVNQIDPKTGKTAIFFIRSIKEAQVLIRHGANINHADHNGNTPLMMATEKASDYCGLFSTQPDDTELMKCFIVNGADCYARNKEKKTVYTLADESPRFKVREVLDECLFVIPNSWKKQYSQQ